MTNSNQARTAADAKVKPACAAYGLHARLGKAEFAATVERVTAALKQEDFGVLTEVAAA